MSVSRPARLAHIRLVRLPRPQLRPTATAAPAAISRRLSQVKAAKPTFYNLVVAQAFSVSIGVRRHLHFSAEPEGAEGAVGTAALCRMVEESPARSCRCTSSLRYQHRVASPPPVAPAPLTGERKAAGF
jgi:hypothetical protein